MTIERNSTDGRVSQDMASGFVYVDGLGFWGPGEIDAILDRIAEFVAVAHSRREAARVLIDLGDNGAQMGDTIERLRKRSGSIYASGDRLAIVLRSSLLKMQVSRVERAAEHRIFATVSEAETWLGASA